MYKLEIFDDFQKMGMFLCKYNITDYRWKDYTFTFMGEKKVNWFLSYNK